MDMTMSLMLVYTPVSESSIESTDHLSTVDF